MHGFVRILALGVGAIISIMAVLSHVPDELTREDVTYLKKILEEAGKGHIRPNAANSATSFETQIALIRDIQAAAFAASPEEKPIPLLRSREPKDVYLARRALCYDRSRLIEKLAIYIGFPTRHVSVYRVARGRAGILALLTPRNASHALSEVKTRRGWLAVDSTNRWIGLDSDGEPLSLSQLGRLDEGKRSWHASVEKPHPILRGRFTHVIGLYSRHGFFYTPYLPFPDYNLHQLAANFVSDDF